MVFGHLALVAAALFTGACLYVNVVEQPARLALADSSALAQWKPARRRGFAMEAVLVLVAFTMGAAAFFLTGNWRWLSGGVLMLANWPYTSVGITPINRRLMAASDINPGPDCRKLLDNWGQLHMVRTGLGAVATLILFWAALD